jgi:biotin carboxyl carrier protein
VSADDAAERREVLVNGHTVSVLDRGNWRVVEWRGRSFRLQRTPAVTVEESERDTGSAGGVGRLTAPMPGRIVKVTVRDGEQVLQNQLLVVLEAMKMEHVVEAPHAGIVTDLHVREGDQVPGGTPLLTLGPPVE